MSRRRYSGEDVDDHVDSVHDEDVQRAIDDKVEAASMQDAFIEGQRAGRLGLASSLNPWQHNTREYAEWERGRSGVIGAALNDSQMRRYG